MVGGDGVAFNPDPFCLLDDEVRNGPQVPDESGSSHLPEGVASRPEQVDKLEETNGLAEFHRPEPNDGESRESQRSPTEEDVSPESYWWGEMLRLRELGFRPYEVLVKKVKELEKDGAQDRLPSMDIVERSRYCQGVRLQSLNKSSDGSQRSLLFTLSHQTDKDDHEVRHGLRSHAHLAKILGWKRLRVIRAIDALVAQGVLIRYRVRRGAENSVNRYWLTYLCPPEGYDPRDTIIPGDNGG